MSKICTHLRKIQLIGFAALVALIVCASLLSLTACEELFDFSTETDDNGSSAGNGKPPSTPTNVKASTESSDNITISWKSVSGADGYYIYRSTSATDTFYNHSWASSPSYIDTGLSECTTYYYKVTAYNMNGESSQSGYVSVTTLEFTGFGSVYDPIPLTEDAWDNGYINSGGSAVWYSFDVTKGATYYIWWNDTSYLNVKVSAFYDGFFYDDDESIFSNINNGWETPQSFTADSSDLVLIKVEPYYSGNTGSFAMVYSAGDTRPEYSGGGVTTIPDIPTGVDGGGTSGGAGSEANPIPLTAGTWTNDSITASAGGSVVWYSFRITSGTKYYVWWNDLYQSEGTKTLSIRVSAYYSNGTSIFPPGQAGWSNPRSFTASSNDTVKIKVEPFSSGSTGTFAIVYSTSSTRPATGTDLSPGSVNNPHQIASEVWTDGSIASGVSAVYYKINANSGTYYIWLNDTDANLGKTLNAQVSAYYSGSGTSLFTNTDVSWTTPQSLFIASGNTVILKVEPLNSGDVGTFAIAYSVSATRPNTNPPSMPTGFTAKSETSYSVLLGWRSATYATSYRIYRSLSIGGAYELVNSTSSLTYTDDKLEASTTYYYKISAVNSFGESAQTGYLYVTTLSKSGSGTFSNPYTLSGGWRDGEITASNGEVYYSYTSGNVLGTCTIRWNDSDNSAKTLDVEVSAYWSGGSTIFLAADTSPQSFSPKVGTIIIIVRPRSSGSTGTFSIQCGTSLF